MSTRHFELVNDANAATVARRIVDEFAQLEDSTLQGRVRLLVTELVTNSVRHAGLAPGDPISLTIAVQPSTVRIAVTDGGPGFGPGRRPPEEEPESGQGLYLLEQLADRWGAADGTVWFEIEREHGLVSGMIARAADRFRTFL